MLSHAGGVGLGLVAGWLVASAPLPRAPGRVAMLLAALGALTAEAALLGDSTAAGGCLVAMALGFVMYRGIELASRRGSGS